MKKILLLSILFLCGLNSFGQIDKEVSLLVANSTWNKEIIQLPFGFAPEMDIKGYQDIRFAEGWADVERDGFWSHVFAWNINLEKKPSVAFFEDNLKLYLDGLMKVINKDSAITIPKTKVSLLETKNEDGITIYRGIVDTYDAFTTKKMITINVTIENYYCDIAKKYMPLFRFSPKAFEHSIWEQLNGIQLQGTACN